MRYNPEDHFGVLFECSIFAACWGSCELYDRPTVHEYTLTYLRLFSFYLSCLYSWTRPIFNTTRLERPSSAIRSSERWTFCTTTSSFTPADDACLCCRLPDLTQGPRSHAHCGDSSGKVHRRLCESKSLGIDSAGWTYGPNCSTAISTARERTATTTTAKL